MSMDVDGQGNPTSEGGNGPPLPLRRFRMPAFIAKKLPRWQRKLKKLQRDPRAFFQDSAVVHLLIKPPAAVSVARKPAAAPGPRHSSAVTGVRVLLADEYHINRKNFPSLFEGLKACRARVAIGTLREEAAARLIHASGNYTEFTDLLADYRYGLEAMTKETLRDFRYHNVDVARRSG